MRGKTLVWLGVSLVAFLLLARSSANAAFALEKTFGPAAANRTGSSSLLHQPPDVQITIDPVVASGFSVPVQVTHAGDGSGRLFVVEQSGKIRIVKNQQVLTTPFIDLSSFISCCGERGLLSVAFHPDYETNGYFYVDYTRAGDGATVVARYSVSANPDVANPNSASILLVVPQPYANHNGGQLMFGPQDGFLYVGLGDGGSGGDPQNYAQNIYSLLGKILRLNVNQGSPYSVPADNPFVGQSGLDEIWSWGLRNPWRFSFDRLTGDMYIGDVGQNLWEEIDFQAAGTPGGVNFGWRCREGAHNYQFDASCVSRQLTEPIAEYSHSEGRSVTGGFVYRGVAFPALQGRYFYADYVDGKIWSVYKKTTNPLTWSTPELELDTGLNLSAFGEDEAGVLYVVDYSGGTIRRLEDANKQYPDLSTSKKQVSRPGADVGEVVTYTIFLTNTGVQVSRPIYLTDTLPAGLNYVPGSLHASQGTWSDVQAPLLTWQSNLNVAQQFTITYQVQPTGVITGSLVNQAAVFVPPDISLNLAQSLAVPASILTTTHQDFFFPGTQPGHLNTEIPASIDCDTCHSQPIYDRWRGSMMSQAGRDPLMWAALYVANIGAPNAGEYCLRCHTPKGWLESRSLLADGSALRPEDISNGVACAVCHRMVDPVPSTGDEAAAIDASIRSGLANPIPQGFTGSGAIIVDPNDRRRGPFSFGLALPYHSAYQTDLLRQTGDAITRSRMCGSCHNVYNPVLSWDAGRGEFWPNAMNAPAPSFNGPNLFPVETTFDEWLYSDYARGGVYAPSFAGSKPDGLVRTCQDCHMTRSIGTAADAGFNPVNRDCQTTGCLPAHTFVGGNTWVPEILQDTAWRLNAAGEAGYLNETIAQAKTLLGKSATLTATITTQATEKMVLVRVFNETGHKLPSGYAEGRQMWLNVRAFDQNGQLIYEAGAYDPLTGQLQRNADTKVYEVKQGLTPGLAALLGKPAGESFHFVLNNTVIKDNRIPPRGYTQTLYDRPGLRPVGAVYADGQYWDDTTFHLPLETESLAILLYYQTASKEYIDFLRSNGGVDGLALGKMWDQSKSPPQVAGRFYWPTINYYLPFVGR